jgi:hypothetical protein
MPKIDYSTPSCPNYGLKHSANTDSAVEFELIKIDYDYLPEYFDLSADDQRISRKSKIDVVDAIHYWLKPVKSKTVQSIKKESLLSVDLHAYIDEQLLYLRKQIEYIGLNITVDENFDGKYSEQDFERVGFLYKDNNNNLLCTPNSVIGILSKTIYSNQTIIDSSIKNAQKN